MKLWVFPLRKHILIVLAIAVLILYQAAQVTATIMLGNVSMKTGYIGVLGSQGVDHTNICNC